eukprot:1157486-Pelagomonas_calceolata.AAC.2
MVHGAHRSLAGVCIKQLYDMGSRGAAAAGARIHGSLRCTVPASFLPASMNSTNGMVHSGQQK